MKILCTLLITLSCIISIRVHAQVILEADGPGNTYELIQSKGYGIESPDCGHAVRHISETNDSQLGKNVFVFTLHRDLDDDRCMNTDRQRIELRGSASGLQGTLGSTTIYRWKFKLDAGFQESPNFTHIFQVKAYGNGHGSGAPILTITPRYNNTLEIIHPGSDPDVVKTASLTPFLGTWCEVFVKIKHDNNGSAELTIKRLSDGATLISWSDATIDMWEDGAGYGAPKFGFYRSLNSPSYLRDESIRFADFCVTKGSESGCPSGIGPACLPVSASSDDGNVPANVLDNNLDTRWSASGDGQWIQFCLSAQTSVSGVQIAFYKGNERRSTFDVLTSTDGTSWTTAASGLESSGTSLALQTFSFAGRTAKYVRIVGHGNNLNAWNSYTEVKIITSATRTATTAEDTPSGTTVLRSYPNPAHDRVTIAYAIKESASVHLSVYNTANGSTSVLINEPREAGSHETILDTKMLPKGLYVIKLIYNGNVHVEKLVKQ
jgi:hypothetical protein